MTRREWMRFLGRGLGLGGLGALTAAVGRRAGPAASREEPCSGGGRCGGCSALARCRLPRGLSAQQVLGKTEGGGHG